mmetsp:Transcript_33517/g.76623  ORF Transcript_33517/g.76623 Transcript_33517/m.76623 type:complete len:232 (-) Transcript_33517:945-1640(-)
MCQDAQSFCRLWQVCGARSPSWCSTTTTRSGSLSLLEQVPRISTGRRNVKVDPVPRDDSTPMLAPILSTRLCTIESPRPCPCTVFRRGEERREPLAKISESNASGGIPMPESSTVTTTSPLVAAGSTTARTPMVTWPRTVYLIALEIRLRTTWRTRKGSRRHSPARRGEKSQSIEIAMACVTPSASNLVTSSTIDSTSRSCTHLGMICIVFDVITISSLTVARRARAESTA